MAKPGPPFLPGLRMIPQERARLKQQVVEVHRVECPEFVLILGKKASQGRTRGFRCLKAEVLGLADEMLGGIRIEGVLLVMDPGGELLDEAGLVPLVKDAEVLLVAQQRGMAAQETDAEGMEGREGDLLCGLRGDGPRDTLPHLLGSLVRERHRQDGGGICLLGDEPGDPRREDACLPCAGSCQDQHRPVRMGRGAVLLGIEVEEAEGGHGGKDGR